MASGHLVHLTQPLLARQVIPDGFIYLRAKPKTCMTRMERRSRCEETGVRNQIHSFSIFLFPFCAT